jgi:hypothetical protein
MVEWMLANFAYGHLDELPDDLLAELLRDLRLTKAFAYLCFQDEESLPAALQTQVDASWFKDPKRFQKLCRVRHWLVIERLRRMEKVGKIDVLVKELATVVPCGLCRPDGKPMGGTIVETSPGIVSIVGEQINLCCPK